MPSPTVNITVTKTYTLKQSEIDAFLSLKGFPLDKPVYDWSGNPIYEEDGTPITEPMTQEEFMAEIEKMQMSWPVVIDATARLEELYGKLNYNAKEMNDYIMNNLTVSVVIE